MFIFAINDKALMGFGAGDGGKPGEYCGRDAYVPLACDCSGGGTVCEPSRMWLFRAGSNSGNAQSMLYADAGVSSGCPSCGVVGECAREPEALLDGVRESTPRKDLSTVTVRVRREHKTTARMDGLTGVKTRHVGMYVLAM